jgi:hypothetical protein
MDKPHDGDVGYLRNLAPEELYAQVGPANYRDSIDMVLRRRIHPCDESSLRPWIENIYFVPHSLVTDPVAAEHPHAEILEGAPARFPQAGKCDYLFVHDGEICGVVELKTYWKVTSAQIDEVINGIHIINLSDHRYCSHLWVPSRSSWGRTNLWLYGS